MDVVSSIDNVVARAETRDGYAGSHCIEIRRRARERDGLAKRGL
jgi:hypothetical protein